MLNFYVFLQHKQTKCVFLFSFLVLFVFWLNWPFKCSSPFPTLLNAASGFTVTSPGSGAQGGGARQKMASLRCRRDPCGVICLILTYFSVLYADYVVVQYVLIPAYSDRSVLCVFMSFKPLKNQHGACFSIHLTADSRPSCLLSRCLTCFFF